MQNRTAELHQTIEAMLDVFDHFGDGATEEVGHFSLHALRLITSGCDPVDTYLELRELFCAQLESIRQDRTLCYESALGRMNQFERALVG